jgi:predicted nucleic acid-binding protein
MTVCFLDTSALVKRYRRERGSDAIDALLAEQGRRIIFSDLSIIEFGSALSKKVREGEIIPEKYQRALGFFCQDIVTEIIHMEVLGDTDEALAVALIEKDVFRSNLRTLDSLQLAVIKRSAQSELDHVLCCRRDRAVSGVNLVACASRTRPKMTVPLLSVAMGCSLIYTPIEINRIHYA